MTYRNSNIVQILKSVGKNGQSLGAIPFKYIGEGRENPKISEK